MGQIESKVKFMQNVKTLSVTELKSRLIASTIGGVVSGVDYRQTRTFFSEYMKRAFPKIKIFSLLPINTSAALNSISATAEIELNGKKISIFAKVHIESETKVINAAGVKDEYRKAGLLVKNGWPVVKPITISQNEDYPLLLYPKMDEPTLFDELEKSNRTGVSTFTAQLISDLNVFNQTIGQKELQSLRQGSSKEAQNAPVQTLFWNRFKPGGRIDQWYTENTLFQLPGLTEPIPWKKLLSCIWKINDTLYSITLQDVIDNARKVLSFKEEKNTFITLSHGDDHAGNIRLTQPPLVFDPAFAGWNPVALDIKALAHTGFSPLAGMYYLPKGAICTYQKNGNQLEVKVNIVDLPIYPMHEELARQIIDMRILPLLQKIKNLGGNIKKESQRIKSGLAGCALLTVNISKLLQQGDGRAIGLLPMAVMFSELKGLPMLEYLDTQIKKL